VLRQYGLRTEDGLLQRRLLRAEAKVRERQLLVFEGRLAAGRQGLNF
jgi:hypothetical protein